MANWNDVKAVANKAIKKTGELTTRATLRTKLELAKARLASAYEKLGRLTYKQLKNSVSQAENISEVIATIDSLNSEVRTLRKKIEEAKKKEEEEKNEEQSSENE